MTKAQQMTVLNYLDDAAEKQVDLLRGMGVTPDLFKRVLYNALAKTPAIATCTRDSIYHAVYRSCEAGLLPDGRHAAIVPMRNKGVATAQFWPMVYGMTTLVRENIPGVVFNVHVAFNDDEFVDERGSAPLLRHVPNPDAKRDVGTVKAIYATAHMPGNDVPEVEVMYRGELLAFKKDNAGPWRTHPLEMFKVRVLKRLLKRMPLAPKMSAMLGQYIDEEQPEDAFEGQPIEVVEEPVETTKPKARAARPKSEPVEEQVTIDAEPEPEPEPVEENTGDMF